MRYHIRALPTWGIVQRWGATRAPFGFIQAVRSQRTVFFVLPGKQNAKNPGVWGWPHEWITKQLIGPPAFCEAFSIKTDAAQRLEAVFSQSLVFCGFSLHDRQINL